MLEKESRGSGRFLVAGGEQTEPEIYKESQSESQRKTDEWNKRSAVLKGSSHPLHHSWPPFQSDSGDSTAPPAGLYRKKNSLVFNVVHLPGENISSLL